MRSLSKFCIGAQSSYAIRVTDPSHVQAELAACDDLLMRELERILGASLTPEQRQQAMLPSGGSICGAGLGIRSLSAAAPVAFCASVSATAPTQQLLLANCSRLLGRPVPLRNCVGAADLIQVLLPDAGLTTASLIHDIHLSSFESLKLQPQVTEYAFKRLFEAADQLDKGRLRSCAGAGSGAFLSAMPFGSGAISSGSFTPAT